MGLLRLVGDGEGLDLLADGLDEDDLLEEDPAANSDPGGAANLCTAGDFDLSLDDVVVFGGVAPRLVTFNVAELVIVICC